MVNIIREHSNNQTCLLIDFLTLWLNNCLFQPIGNHSWQQVIEDFLHAISEADGHIILVSNEVGQGIVPLGEVFADLSMRVVGCIKRLRNNLNE